MKKCYLCDDEDVVLQPVPNSIIIEATFDEPEITLPEGSLLCDLCTQYIVRCHVQGRIKEIK